MSEDCTYCEGDGCYDCLPPPEPDYEATLAARDWDAGEYRRWAGQEPHNP